MKIKIQTLKLIKLEKGLKMVAKINKYPYFLWLNQSVEVTLDNEQIHIKDNESGEVNRSVKNRISKIEIFFMKHLPALALFVYIFFVDFFIPEILAIGIGFCVFALGVFIVNFYPKWFKKYILLICIGGLYMTFQNSEVLFEHSLYVVVEATLFFFLLRELYALIKEDEYYCIQEIDSSDIEATKKSKVTISNLNFGGYYLRTKK